MKPVVSYWCLNIIIVLKGGANRDFLQSPHCAANRTRTLKWPGRNRVQHIERSSCATCRGTKGQLLSLTEFKSHLFELTDERGKKTVVPGENPWRRASENATY